MLRKFYDLIVDCGGTGGVFVVEHKNVSAKEIIECECGTHMLKVESDTDIFKNSDDTVQANQTFYFAMFGYGNQKRGFWGRLAIAWKYLRTGSMYSDQLTFTPEEAAKLSAFITSNSILNKEAKG